MANLNKVMLMGNLTRDPELRYTPQGVPVMDVGLAVNREWGGGEGGERKKETTFVDITFWRRQAEVISQYLKKGDPMFIEGRLSLDQWEQDGQKRSKLKVVGDHFQFLPRSGGGGGGRPSSTGGDSQYQDYQYPGSDGAADRQPPQAEAIEDSDIPF